MVHSEQRSITPGLYTAEKWNVPVQSDSQNTDKSGISYDWGDVDEIELTVVWAGGSGQRSVTVPESH